MARSQTNAQTDAPEVEVVESTVETTESAPEVVATKEVQLNERQLAKSFHMAIVAQDLYDVQISPLYQAEFGRVMPVSVQGIYVACPVDGSTFQVREAYAQIIRERIAAVDAKYAASNKLSNVAQNLERSPGELELLK